ncbi:hypothetical protein CCHR01_18940 [Colletotrichum chrysophilum]|uniref:WSC domain-containing protein n=1 Tax=Colletotrichum chrysophilum TaxID=1836956 RepID=A0AAD9E5K8_9PEZI|nr:hypothetical protein CCHR01_18940 [Colletotrichum chrysophilum]
MRVSTILSLAALPTGIIAITSTTVLTPVEQSPYYYLGCYPYTAETAIGAYDIPNIATGYNNGNPVDCQIGCDQQFHAPYVFMYGTYCYCQVREFEFDIHQPGGAPVDNSFCTTPCFVDPNAPCGTLSNTDAGRYVTVYGKYGPRASFSPRVSSTSSTRPSVTTLSSIGTLASSSTSPIPQSRSLVPVPRPPYSYLGCYSFVSVQSGAIWQFQSTAVGDPVACQAACDAAGSPFLMMLFDSCYCQPASAGINAPPGLPAADSECSIACRNSPGSPCGGSASGLFYTVYGVRQPGVSSSNTLPSTASRLTSTRTSMSSASPSASLFPDPLPPYNYVGCYYMLSIYNTDVFTLQGDILGNPAACQARCLDRLRSHFVTLVGTVCYCGNPQYLRINNPPVDDSFCAGPCLNNPASPCGRRNFEDNTFYSVLYGDYLPEGSLASTSASALSSAGASTRGPIMFTPGPVPTSLIAPGSLSISTISRSSAASSSVQSPAISRTSISSTSPNSMVLASRSSTSTSTTTVRSATSSSTRTTANTLPSPASPYSYLGCYDNDLQYQGRYVGVNSAGGDPAACQAACARLAAPFLLMFSISCLCQTGGVMAPPRSLLVDESLCTIVCEGNRTARCGGRNAGTKFSVYGYPVVQVLPGSSISSTSTARLATSLTTRLTASSTSIAGLSVPRTTTTPSNIPAGSSSLRFTNSSSTVSTPRAAPIVMPGVNDQSTSRSLPPNLATPATSAIPSSSLRSSTTSTSSTKPSTIPAASSSSPSRTTPTTTRSTTSVSSSSRPTLASTGGLVGIPVVLSILPPVPVPPNPTRAMSA